MKKSIIIVSIVIVLVITVVVALAIKNKDKDEDDGKEEKTTTTKKFSDADIDRIESLMDHCIFEFDDEFGYSNVIRKKDFENWKESAEELIGYEIDAELELRRAKEETGTKDYWTNSNGFDEVEDIKDNETLMNELEEDGKIKLEAGDVVNITISLKDKKLMRNERPSKQGKLIVEE